MSWKAGAGSWERMAVAPVAATPPRCRRDCVLGAACGVFERDCVARRMVGWWCCNVVLCFFCCFPPCLACACPPIWYTDTDTDTAGNPRCALVCAGEAAAWYRRGRDVPRERVILNRSWPHFFSFLVLSFDFSFLPVSTAVRRALHTPPRTRALPRCIHRGVVNQSYQGARVDIIHHVHAHAHTHTHSLSLSLADTLLHTHTLSTPSPAD
jgi:hypothetical protein